MKKQLLILLLLWAGVVLAQNPRTKKDYIKQIHQFYTYLYSDKPVTYKNCKDLYSEDGFGELDAYLFDEDCKVKHINPKNIEKLWNKYIKDSTAPSFYFLSVKQQTQALTQGLNEQEMYKLLNNSAELIDIGESNVIFIKMSFPNHKYTYFSMERLPDEPFIGNVFLPDGASEINKPFPQYQHFLELPGKINDPDGYVNIRKEPNAQSKIVGTIKSGDEFTYTPNCNNLWWKVQKKNKNIGYVYYDRIETNKKQLQ